jgi:hypothetical protein
MLSKPSYSERYIESQDTVKRLADIKLVLKTTRGLPIGDRLKRTLLSQAIWQVAHATGNFRGRYRSENVIRQSGLEIERDHIYPKTRLIEQIMSASDNLDDVLDQVIQRARCCTVSADEHERLHDFDSELDGWNRYEAAGIVVYDMLTVSRMNFRAAIEGTIQPDPPVGPSVFIRGKTNSPWPEPARRGGAEAPRG